MKNILTPISKLLHRMSILKSKPLPTETQEIKPSPSPARSVKRYSKKELVDIASCYTTKSHFKKYEKKAYETAQKRGLLKEIYEATGLEDQNQTWDEKSVKQVARLAGNASTLSKDFPGAYGWAKANNKLKELAVECFNPVVKHYTKSEIREQAKACSALSTFNHLDNGRYARRARKLGIFDEVTAHMTRGIQNPSVLNAAYAIVNQEQKLVYVGVTSRPLLERYEGHKDRSNSCRSKKIMKSPETTIVQITPYKYTNAQVVSEKVEERLAECYKGDGYTVLNDPSSYGKLGSGKPSKYTKTYLKKEAKRFKKRSHFKKQCGPEYRAAQRMGPTVFKEITAHMPNPRPKHWKHIGKKPVLAEVERLKKKGCTTRSSLNHRCQSLYNRVNSLGLMDELYPRMTTPKRSDEELVEIAKRFKDAAELRNNNRRIYKQLSNRKLLKKAFKK